MMALLLLMCVAAAVAPVLAHGSLRRRAFTHAATSLKALARISEAIRLRLAAALLDLGNHLMLSADERKAFRLRGWLSSARARRLGVAAAAVRAGARRFDGVTLEIPVGERTQEGNPGRTLALSCVVYEPPGRGAGDPLEDVPSLFWRVVNRASPGHRGPSVTVEVPELHRALITYHARPLHQAESPGARFLDEGVHDETSA
ncbi:MAG: hypothetical protein H0T55_03290 [Rubrobacteraceae bacterium]|nr:hypothetical protein [Rubrobacteraceae bacterium]